MMGKYLAKSSTPRSIKTTIPITRSSLPNYQHCTPESIPVSQQVRALANYATREFRASQHLRIPSALPQRLHRVVGAGGSFKIRQTIPGTGLPTIWPSCRGAQRLEVAVPVSETWGVNYARRRFFPKDFRFLIDCDCEENFENFEKFLRQLCRSLGWLWSRGSRVRLVCFRVDCGREF